MMAFIDSVPSATAGAGLQAELWLRTRASDTIAIARKIRMPFAIL
jgi:hypothetical protein